MELFLENTARGLIPLYDEDFDEKKKLKIGEVYKVSVKIPRNFNFHKKYFALLNCAWEYLNEKTQAHFNNDKSHFRKTIEIAAGHCEPIFSISRKEYIDVPKSICFDKMDEKEFSELYERVKDVLFCTVLRNISIEIFMKNLNNF